MSKAIPLTLVVGVST